MSDLREAREQLASLTGGLVVSCQAREDNPLHGPVFMAAMARAAVAGGAVGIRANGPKDVRAIHEEVNVPILGINKVKLSDGTVFITPSRESVREIMEAGAKLVALDGTPRERPGGEWLADVIRFIHEEGGCALADVSTLTEGLAAAALGADAIGTTLSGYTDYSRQHEGPDLELVEQLSKRLVLPIFAEGRIWTPADVSRSLEAGAAFVVVGTAITNPQAITQRFVREIRPVTTTSSNATP